MKLTKFGVLMTVLTLLFGSTIGGVGQALAQQQFIRGDADGDCLVSVLDVDFLICYRFTPGSPPPPCGDAADANDDGKVDPSDIVYLIGYLFMGGNPPPPPFPNPGTDPTPDSLDCAVQCVAPVPSNLDSLIVSSVSGSAGDTIVVPIIVRNSQDLLAYQIHLEFDPNILQVTEVLNTGVVDPQDFGVDTLSPGVVNIWCYIDCLWLRSIPAGRHTLVKIMFQVNRCAPCGATLLDLKDVTGPPFFGNLFSFGGGKVYPTLVDGNLTIERAAPCIISITDVGNDQGRQVRLNWAQSCYDATGSPVTITEYSLWRRIGEDKTGGFEGKMLSSYVETLKDTRLYPPGDWDFIKTVPARGEEEYNTICPTLGDSTQADSMYWSVFFVSAMTSNPLVYFDSDPDSGYSLDNIPPIGVKNLDIPRKTGDTLVLKWMVPGEYPGEQPATAYDIRYSTNPIGSDTSYWWDSTATQCEGEPYPAPAGSIDSFMVTLDLTKTYYFAMKLLDDRPNYSEISNIVQFRCGDVNGDSKIDASDVVYLINYLYISGPPPVPMAVGDVNCDGVINASDVVYLTNYLYINGPKPCSP
jgi:hypothetical protein